MLTNPLHFFLFDFLFFLFLSLIPSKMGGKPLILDIDSKIGL